MNFETGEICEVVKVEWFMVAYLEKDAVRVDKWAHVENSMDSISPTDHSNGKQYLGIHRRAGSSHYLGVII